MYLKPLDRFLDGITMYKLMLYGLGLLALNAIIFGFIGILEPGGLWQLASLAVLVYTAYGVNFAFGKAFGVVTNAESSVITALILFFVFSPATSAKELIILAAAVIMAMASKYIIAYRGRHLFNPAALAAVVLGFSVTTAASWWVATPTLLPVMAILGCLVARKIKRGAMVATFLLVTTTIITVTSLQYDMTPWEALTSTFTSWPLVFFGTIMLTEPITSPPRRLTQVIYAIIVAVLFSSHLHVGPVYGTPEIALLIGNLFAYSVSSRVRLTLTLKEKREVAKDIFEFVFTPNYKLNYQPGQYAEWTLDHKTIDQRGNRRYFTLASSPTEKDILLGVRMVENGSSFKAALNHMKLGDRLYAGQRAGDFVLPKNSSEKLLFIAGGIGITPFRSMLVYLRDTNDRRDITVMYSVKQAADIAYREILDDVATKLGIKIIYVVSEAATTPGYETGMINADMLQRLIPDVTSRSAYISGPPAMVKGLSKTLRGLGVGHQAIHTDYFPGFGG